MMLPTISSHIVDREVQIPAGHATLNGNLAVPEGATGIVIFAHGSGSSRFSPRNQFVAGALQSAGIGTLLIDLLEEWEEHDREKVFDIELLADRLRSAARWLHHESADLPIGYFGASTGAGAALVAAADEPAAVKAVVSRGGRPDLADGALHLVQAPTLLIVGGDDEHVLELNKRALRHLPCVKSLAVVPAATHLFEEAGTLDEVARLARDWFARYLGPSDRAKHPTDDDPGRRVPRADMDLLC